MDKIMASDGIVLSSPNYIDNVTAQLKTLMDRMTNAIHEQLFDGKYGFSITTAGRGGEEIVLNMMNSFIIKSGGYATGSSSGLMSQGPKGMKDAIAKSKTLGMGLVAAIREKRQFPEQEDFHRLFRERFAVSLKFNKDYWPHNYQHRVEKGWIKP
jgi:multimeric flavodoxin WrbA